MNANLVLHAVGQVLVEVRQRVGVVRERLVLASEPVTCGDLAEAVEVDDVEGAGKASNGERG